jgi:hypothetical protein
MLGEEESPRVELQQSVSVVDRPKLQHQNRIVVAESREKTAVHEEGRHAIRSALGDVREPEQQTAGLRDRDAT